MEVFSRISEGLSRSRERFSERMNVLFDRGPDVDEDFWDGLEEALILSDVGAPAAIDIVEEMRDYATRNALPDAYAVMDALADHIAAAFTEPDGVQLFDENPVLVLFVGINGAGKTTTVGKIAAERKARGRKVLLGSADTFRAAAIEQLEEWSVRAGVEVVERERGADPASVCYDTIERAEATNSDLVLIDTAGRLHTSDDLMRELEKVVNVTRKRSNMPVRTVLVVDATTGQNGLSQAREFNRTLDLDGIIVTKLDGTAKGGIALAISHDLKLPVVKIGVGESLEDLQDFDAHDFAAALIGSEPVEDEEQGEDSEILADRAEAQEAEDVESAASAETVEETGEGADTGSTDAVDIDTASSGLIDTVPDESEPVADAAGNDIEPAGGELDESEQQDTDEPEQKQGRLRRLFKWRGRKRD